MVRSGLKRIAVVAALVLSVGPTGAARAATMDADVMFVVDGSGSMGDDFVDLGKGMTTFVNGLKADPRVGSVRVGLVRYSLNPVLNIAMTDDLTVFDGLTRKRAPTRREPADGDRLRGEQPGHQVPARGGEDAHPHHRRGGQRLRDLQERVGHRRVGDGRHLKDMGFLNNVIHNPGKKGSTENYGSVALPYGALFDIMDFRADPMGFLEAFAKVKVQEFADVRLAQAAALAPVPLPAGAWLLIGGLGAMASLRRRKAA